MLLCLIVDHQTEGERTPYDHYCERKFKELQVDNLEHPFQQVDSPPLRRLGRNISSSSLSATSSCNHLYLQAGFRLI